MKKSLLLSVFIASTILFSCEDKCSDIAVEYGQLSKMHQQKKGESSALFYKLEAIPIDSVQDITFVEDELMMILIEITIIEIEMENLKNKHNKCL